MPMERSTTLSDGSLGRNLICQDMQAGRVADWRWAVAHVGRALASSVLFLKDLDMFPRPRPESDPAGGMGWEILD